MCSVGLFAFDDLDLIEGYVSKNGCSYFLHLTADSVLRCGLRVWNLCIRGGSFSANTLPTVRFVANQSVREVLAAGEKKRDPSHTGQGQEML